MEEQRPLPPHAMPVHGSQVQQQQQAGMAHAAAGPRPANQQQLPPAEDVEDAMDMDVLAGDEEDTAGPSRQRRAEATGTPGTSTSGAAVAAAGSAGAATAVGPSWQRWPEAGAAEPWPQDGPGPAALQQMQEDDEEDAPAPVEAGAPGAQGLDEPPVVLMDEAEAQGGAAGDDGHGEQGGAVLPAEVGAAAGAVAQARAGDAAEPPHERLHMVLVHANVPGQPLVLMELDDRHRQAQPREQQQGEDGAGPAPVAAALAQGAAAAAAGGAPAGAAAAAPDAGPAPRRAIGPPRHLLQPGGAAAAAEVPGYGLRAGRAEWPPAAGPLLEPPTATVDAWSEDEDDEHDTTAEQYYGPQHKDLQVECGGEGGHRVGGWVCGCAVFGRGGGGVRCVYACACACVLFCWGSCLRGSLGGGTRGIWVAPLALDLLATAQARGAPGHAPPPRVPHSRTSTSLVVEGLSCGGGGVGGACAAEGYPQAGYAGAEGVGGSGGATGRGLGRGFACWHAPAP